jgi:hypothetical protein
VSNPLRVYDDDVFAMHSAVMDVREHISHRTLAPPFEGAIETTGTLSAAATPKFWPTILSTDQIVGDGFVSTRV